MSKEAEALLKTVSKLDYGELKFPLPGYIISHPEHWDVTFKELFNHKEIKANDSLNED